MPAATDLYAHTAEFYDRLEKCRVRGDVPFFVEEARKSGGPVLELGCGTGRVLLPTARAGIEITGLDSSSAMLDRCGERLVDEDDQTRERVTLVHGDMQVFNLGQRFALITVPFRGFQHLADVDAQVACLACVRQHLRPEGSLILDLFNPSFAYLARPLKGEEQMEGSPFGMSDGRRVQCSSLIRHRDLFRQLQHLELIFDVTHPDGCCERLVDVLPMRYLFRYEAEHLLARAGFAVDTVYADYDRSLFGTRDPGELIVVASQS